MSKPLKDRRILVTRAAGQASTLAILLEEQGADAVLIPTIELGPPSSWCALDAAITTILTYDWLLFTSANAVSAYVQRARTLGLAARARRIGVIGPATARAVRESGLAEEVDLMPARYVAEAFAEALVPLARGANMLLVRAAEARDVLPEALFAAGANLTVVEAYRSVVPAGSVEALRALFGGQNERLDAITFTSASTARNLSDLLESGGLTIPAGTVLASIGPVTSQAMRELNLMPSVEAEVATIPALVEALSLYFTAD